MNEPIQISVREPGKESGGSVAASVRESGGHLDGHDRVVILIHGYNNNLSEALRGYAALLKNLGIKFAAYTGQPAELFWPGDSPLKIVSTLSYPNQIHPAIESARRLSTYLSQLRGARNGPMEVSFIGHSLGCRVVLELFALWTAGLPAQVRLGAIVLMAAAVVVKHVNFGGQLRAAALLPGDSLVLHSKSDAVLHWTFPTGETAAGEGFFPTAVGRAGDPAKTWHDCVPMVTATGQGYGHGSYWYGDESANAVVRTLGGPAPVAHPVNALIGNPVPQAKAITPRSTPTRGLLFRPAFA